MYFISWNTWTNSVKIYITVRCRSAMFDVTKLALFKHYTTLYKHYTVSAITSTALRNIITTTRTDNLSPCLLVVDQSRTVQPVAQSLYRLSYPAHSQTFSNSISNTSYTLVMSSTTFRKARTGRMPIPRAELPSPSSLWSNVPWAVCFEANLPVLRNG